MFEYRFAFESPWYLGLLAVLPALWWFGHRSLSSLGPMRRLTALALRTVVLVLIVLALAELQLVRRGDRLTVIYLLDQSLSIPAERRQEMIEYVNRSIVEHRTRPGDRAGVIVFGRDAAIEVPPFDDDVQLAETIETLIDPDHTDLAAAMRLAQASFPDDAAKRIVIISDGSENLGDALEQARDVVDSGIGIDVVPVQYRARSEVLVEKLAVPPDVRQGDPFDLRVVVTNTAEATDDDPGIVTGRLIVTERTSNEPIVLSEQHVQLQPGKQVFTVRQRIELADFYTYEARFVPDDPVDDALPQNNRATAFTYVRGSGQVLLIENFETPGEHKHLVDRLRANNLEVMVRGTDQLFTDLAELQQFDTVILANVPREEFSDEQIDMLVQNTQQLGCGLVMLGGPNSFGAGGWLNTPLEKAMPVDFQIKAAKVVPRGALAMVMHACEIPQGNHWQKVIAKEAVRALGNQDLCGLLHWDGTHKWLWNPGMREVGSSRDRMLALIDKCIPGDMPEFNPTMEMARREFARMEGIGVKHMIIVSDGDPAPPSNQVIRGLQALNVTVSTVAVGAHGPAESGLLRRIANQTGGKYYEVRNANALPRIFQREARRVSRPLIYEDERGFSPQLKFPNELVSGISDPLPPITGFVMTTVKENPLVEVALVSPVPAEEANNTILANWTYGLGRAVAFTPDAGARWATQWTGWEDYDKLFSQTIRWSMRPTGEQGNFVVSTDVQDEKIEVIVTALDKEDDFLNFLQITGTTVGPDLEPRTMKMEQIAPGRYRGTIDAVDSGSYFLMLNPGGGMAPIRTGVNVPYSAEFRNRVTNLALLQAMAGLAPRGGSPGTVIETPDGSSDVEQLLQVDPFRHDLPPATSRQDVWHLLLFIAGCLFFFDVLIRRVAIHFGWVPVAAARVRDRLLGREPAPPTTETMARLRNRKSEVSEQLESRRAAARFEFHPESVAAEDALQQELQATGHSDRPQRAAGKPQPDLSATPEVEEESYTSRLLKAKQDVWKDRDKKS